MKKLAFALCFVTLLLSSCREDESYVALDHHQSLTGTWLQTEYGGSPGAGYYTRPVSPNPPMTITFNSSGRCTSNMQGLSDYSFYRLLEDPASEAPVLAFFKTDPGVTPEIASSDHTYSVVWEEKKLKIHYRWCIEGCHLGFQKIDAEDRTIQDSESSGN